MPFNLRCEILAFLMNIDDDLELFPDVFLEVEGKC